LLCATHVTGALAIASARYRSAISSGVVAPSVTADFADLPKVRRLSTRGQTDAVPNRTLGKSTIVASTSSG